MFRYNTTASEPKILVLWKMSRIHRRTKVLEKEESALLETQFSPMDTPTLGKQIYYFLVDVDTDSHDLFHRKFLQKRSIISVSA